MNRIWLVGGVLAILVGIVFFFQGTGLLKGSSMTGETFWLWVGLVLIVVGGVVVFRVSRSARRPSS
jgi:hypothetical protein